MTGPTPAHPAALDDEALLAQCQVQRTRGAGPGGQHRNKTETAVRLVHQPTGLRAQAGERRSQRENHRRALRRLRVTLALHVRREPDALEPSALWQSRCQQGRIVINPRHDDFPLMLAEALDVVADRGFDLAHAAGTLGVTTSQLVKFLKLEPAAHHHVNTERQHRGLKPMH